MSTYLVSIYFDSETNKYIQRITKCIADKIGNNAMLDIPPHITVGMIRIDNQDVAVEGVKKISKMIKNMELQLVSIGMFGNKVVYVQPIISRELQLLNEMVAKEFSEWIPANSRYQPYGWIPHITLAKHLTNNQQIDAIKVLQSENVFRKIQIKKIGIATTKPYKDVAVYEVVRE